MSTPQTRLPPRTVLLVLACALFVSVVAGREARRAEPSAAAAPAPAPRAQAPALDLASLEREGFAEPQANPFAPVAPPPPPRAARAAPERAAAPAAPPLPFRYLGRFVDGGETAVFIAHGDEPLRAEPGAQLPGAYRVEALAADAITLRYLPLDTVHRVPIPPRE